jgi:hypothetical protein
MPSGKEPILHAGVMIGRERKTERNTLRTLALDLCLLWEGWTREEGWRGGTGGGGGGGAVDCGSPINGG